MNARLKDVVALALGGSPAHDVPGMCPVTMVKFGELCQYLKLE